MGQGWRAWRRPGGPERDWRGPGVQGAYQWRREREAQCCSLGEGNVDMGRRMRAWRRSGEGERRERGAGRSWLGLRERECASERPRRGGAVGTVRAGGGCAARGGGRAAVCRIGPRCGASRASQEASAGIGGLHVVPPGTGGGRSPPAFMDLPRRGVEEVAVGRTGGVVVPGGAGPRGPLRRGRGGKEHMVLGRRGPVAGGRQGSGVERLVGGAVIPCASAARARGVVSRWGRVVGSGSGGGGGAGGGSGGGGGASGSCAVSGGGGAAGMPLGSLGVPVGLEGRASVAALGAVRLCG